MNYNRSFCLSIVAVIVCTFLLYFFDKNMHKDRDKQEVNVYIVGKEDYFAEIFQKFTDKTGIKINPIYGKADEDIANITKSKKNVDVFIANDVMTLEKAKSAGILQHIDDMEVFANVEKNLYDDDHQWVGLSKRARIIAFNKEKIDPRDINTYFDLQNSKWKGKILISSLKNPHNQALIAAMLFRKDKQDTKNWLDGLNANLVRSPQGGEMEQIFALRNGMGDLAVLNSCCYGHFMQNNKDNKEVLERIGVIFPNQKYFGSYINIIGAAIFKNAQNISGATELLKFILNEDMQSYIAFHNFDFPVIKSKVTMPSFMEIWSEKKMDNEVVQKISEYDETAMKLSKKLD